VECNLDLCIDRLHSDSAKWRLYDPDVLPLWVADMDFLSAEPVIRALHERIDHGVFGYGLCPDELVEVIQARLDTLYGWQVDADEIVFCPGVVTGFNIACRLRSEPGDGVLVQPPVYYPFLAAPANAGRVLQQAEIKGSRENGSMRYALDVDAFEAAFTDRTRAFILCNPHNPIGRVYERNELLAMAEVCLRHNTLICSDEIHCDLVFSGHKHIPIAALDPEIAQNTVTLMAPSKTYNIAGLKCSFAVIQNEELRREFCAARAGLVPSVNILGYTAALAAYRDGQPWLDEVLAYLEANRDYVKRYVDESLPGIEMTVPEGTYLAWLDCRGAGFADKRSAGECGADECCSDDRSESQRGAGECCSADCSEGQRGAGECCSDDRGLSQREPTECCSSSACGAVERGSTEPADFFLEHARVALNNGATFGPGGEGFVRLNFACPRETLTEALERMKNALESQ
jgi:cystathionine beta-lyase